MSFKLVVAFFGTTLLDQGANNVAEYSGMEEKSSLGERLLA